MQCPRDHHALGRETYASIELDRCTECGGTWLDKGELDAVLAKDREAPPPTEIDSIDAAFEMARESTLPPAPCPVCGTEMSRDEYAHSSQVLIDACPRGHGLWLDAGELERIERFYEEERRGAQSFFARVWRELSEWELGRG